MSFLDSEHKKTSGFDQNTLELIYALQFLINVAIPGIIKASAIIYKYANTNITPMFNNIYNSITKEFSSSFSASMAEFASSDVDNNYQQKLIGINSTEIVEFFDSL